MREVLGLDGQPELSPQQTAAVVHTLLKSKRRPTKAKLTALVCEFVKKELTAAHQARKLAATAGDMSDMDVDAEDDEDGGGAVVLSNKRTRSASDEEPSEKSSAGEEEKDADGEENRKKVPRTSPSRWRKTF